MANSPAIHSPASMRAEKRAVAGNSVLAAIAITTLKIVVGVTTGSLGILSEAAHSGLDLIAAIVTFLSVRVSDKPADADHQYGHGKVENFSAFIETGLLLLTCVWIIYEAAKRLFFRHVEIEPSIAAFAVMFISMVVDFWRSRALGRIATKYDSQALEADALHFSTDIWSSGVVVVGLALVWLGRVYGVEWLRDADPVAAIFVAGVVVYVSWRLARRTVDALLDAAPAGVRARIMAAVNKVDGLLEVDRVRIRRAVATRNNFNVHDISVQDLRGRLHVEQHLELDEQLSLKEAHDQVTRLELEIRHDVPEISTILTHIESEPATIETGDEVVRDALLEKKLKEVAAHFPEVLDVHEVEVKHVRGRLYVSCHCTFSDELPLSRVHDISTELEIHFKQEAPELFRVLIHPEPQTDNRR